MGFKSSRKFFFIFKRQILSRVYLVRITLLILLLSVLFSAWYFFFRPVTQIHLPTHNGRTNFLLLGVSGGAHDGANLTDTIIFASFKPSTGTIDLISVPRDLWVPSANYKINSSYADGLAQKGSAAGLVLIKSAVSEVLDQPVDYAILIDFSTFIKAIDLVGGLDITVSHAFTDLAYPISGKEADTCGLTPSAASNLAAQVIDDLNAATLFPCRYETLSFTSGNHHFDGATALKFARSRHSTDLTEGTDFARSARQTQVLKAFKQKLFSPETITHPQIYQQLYQLTKSSLITDIPSVYYPSLAQLGLRLKKAHLNTYSISALLINPPISEKYDSQWVLIPKNNNPLLIYDFVSTQLK